MNCKPFGLALVLAGSALLPGLAQVQAENVSQNIWQVGDQYVRVVPREHPADSAGSANEHPAALSEDALGRAFARLEIHGSKALEWFSDRSGTTTPVFVAAELEQLIPALVRAFAMAKPDEDVVFAIVGMHPGLISKERQVTAGRTFFQGGRLQLIFGDFHRPLHRGGGQDVRGANLDEDRRLQPFVSGSRSARQQPDWTIANTAGLNFAATGGVPRHDWLILDLQAPSPTVPPPEPTPTASPAPRSDVRPAPPAPAPASSERSPQQRLRTLRDLRNEGLIDEQEYRAKRRQILDQL